MNNDLPKQFDALREFVGDWVLDSEQARLEKRLNTNYEAIKLFYERIIPLMPDIMKYLEDKPVSPDTQCDTNLMFLALSCVEVSRIFEVWGKSDVRADYFDPKRITCVGYEGVSGN